MAKVKLKFRPSTVTDKEGTLYYKVTHKRVDRQINTKFNGVLTYSRKKTTQPLIIRQLPKMEEIISRYAASCSGDYLLPILSETDIVKSRLQYKNESRKVNTQLKKLGEMLELPIKLTMYVARHSWATAAQKIYIHTSLLIRML